jgi:hypothetical protein
MNPNANQADYLLPWAVIDQDPGLASNIKHVLIQALGDEIFDEELGESRMVPPRVADFTRLSEEEFRKYRGVGKKALHKLKQFLTDHGKTMPVVAFSGPEQVPLDHWTEAAKHFKMASKPVDMEPGGTHLCKGLHHMALALREMDATLQRISGTENPTPANSEPF